MRESYTLTSPIMWSGSGKALRGKGMQRLAKGTHTLPEISVTEIKNVSHNPDQNSLPSTTQKTASIGHMRVHLISCRDAVTESTRTNPNNSHTLYSLHDEVINTLQDEFNVRVGNRSRRKSQISLTLESQLSKSPHQLPIAKSDICMYLFTNATLEDSNCFHDLCTAIALKIPVVFVRAHGADLPKNFTECIRRNSYGCLSFSAYIDRYVMDNHSRDSPIHIQNAQKRKTIRKNNRLAPLSVRCRPTSASELNVRGIDIRKGKRKQAPDDDTDLLLYLINSFQNAFAVDHVERTRSSHMLKQYIYKSIRTTHEENLGQYDPANETKTYSLSDSDVKDTNGRLYALSSNDSETCGSAKAQHRLRVPETELMISTREWARSGSVSFPAKVNTNDGKNTKACPSKDGRFSYDIRMVSPLPLEERETTYLLFQNKSSPDGIRKINYPGDKDELQESGDDPDSSDESDPRNSPIHITDIDLAREVNKSMEMPDSDNV